MECNKTSFATLAFANWHIKKIKAKSKKDVIPTRAYKCGQCGAYHLTSKENFLEKNSGLEQENLILKTRVKELEELNSLLSNKESNKLVEQNRNLKVKNKELETALTKANKTNKELMQNLVNANLKNNKLILFGKMK